MNENENNKKDKNEVDLIYSMKEFEFYNNKLVVPSSKNLKFEIKKRVDDISFQNNALNKFNIVQQKEKSIPFIKNRTINPRRTRFKEKNRTFLMNFDQVRKKNLLRLTSNILKKNKSETIIHEKIPEKISQIIPKTPVKHLHHHFHRGNFNSHFLSGNDDVHSRVKTEQTDFFFSLETTVEKKENKEKRLDRLENPPKKKKICPRFFEDIKVDPPPPPLPVKNKKKNRIPHPVFKKMNNAISKSYKIKSKILSKSNSYSYYTSLKDEKKELETNLREDPLYQKSMENINLLVPLDKIPKKYFMYNFGYFVSLNPKYKDFLIHCNFMSKIKIGDTYQFKKELRDRMVSLNLTNNTPVEDQSFDNEVRYRASTIMKDHPENMFKTILKKVEINKKQINRVNNLTEKLIGQDKKDSEKLI